MEHPSTFSTANGLFVIFSVIFLVICHWRIFEKAGKPGWAALIPVYNIIVLLEIAGKPLWWIILLFIPAGVYFITGPSILLLATVMLALVFYILLIDGVARSFGKDIGFTIALVCLGIIFLPILAFGDAVYLGPEKGRQSQKLQEKEI